MGQALQLKDHEREAQRQRAQDLEADHAMLAHRDHVLSLSPPPPTSPPRPPPWPFLHSPESR